MTVSGGPSERDAQTAASNSENGGDDVVDLVPTRDGGDGADCGAGVGGHGQAHPVETAASTSGPIIGGGPKCERCGVAPAGVTHICPPPDGFNAPGTPMPPCPMCWRTDGTHVLGCAVERYISDRGLS